MSKHYKRPTRARSANDLKAHWQPASHLREMDAKLFNNMRLSLKENGGVFNGNLRSNRPSGSKYAFRNRYTL